jgi:2,3-bisphosphoglycerate-independent phosphoglycerate mutase
VVIVGSQWAPREPVEEIGRDLLSAPALPQPWVVWPSGANLSRVLHSSTTVIDARGAAAGCAILLGAHMIVPRGATGDTDTDYHAKVKAVLNMLDSASRVVVHFGATDEASHRGDRDAKVRALELIDELVLQPLMGAVGERRGLLRVRPDHGTDVSTGEHLSSLMPALSWGRSIQPSGPDHLWERALLRAVGV